MQCSQFGNFRLISQPHLFLFRRAQEKVVEVVIDFKKKIAYDHTKDSSDQEATNAAAAEEGNSGEAVEEAVIPVEVVKTEQELEAEADRAAIASVLLASAAVKKKRKKHKFALTPLPLVPCVQFRGSSGRSKQSMGMMQSFATLFKMVAQSFGNRDVVSFVCDFCWRIQHHFLFIRPTWLHYLHRSRARAILPFSSQVWPQV